MGFNEFCNQCDHNSLFFCSIINLLQFPTPQRSEPSTPQRSEPPRAGPIRLPSVALTPRRHRPYGPPAQQLQAASTGTSTRRSRPVTITKEVVCLPSNNPFWLSQNTLTVPRSRERLAASGLVGMISLNMTMDPLEVRREFSKLFHTAFGVEEEDFLFQYLRYVLL